MTQIDFATYECRPRTATLFIYERAHKAFNGALPNPIHVQSVALTEVTCQFDLVWSEFVLSPPVNVVSGKSYTFKVDPTDKKVVQMPFTTGNTYARGQSYAGADSYDVLFRTYAVLIEEEA
jgi:hypothetical protein